MNLPAASQTFPSPQQRLVQTYRAYVIADLKRQPVIVLALLDAFLAARHGAQTPLNNSRDLLLLSDADAEAAIAFLQARP